MVFPTSLAVPKKEFIEYVCGGNYYCTEYVEQYVKENIDTDYKSKGYITTDEAQEYVKKFRFGYLPHFATNPVAAAVLAGIRNRFFAGSLFDENHSTISPLVLSAREVKFKDVDTFSVDVQPRATTFRLSGIDGPESFLGIGSGAEFEYNSKLKKFMDYIWLYWIKRYGLSGDIGASVAMMIRNRIRYTGLIAGAVSKGLDAWAERRNIPFSTFPSFDRIPLTAEECNTINLTDFYDRFLGVPVVGTPNEPSNLLQNFIREELPLIMETEGMVVYNYYRSGVGPATPPEWPLDILETLTPRGKQILSALKRDPQRKDVWAALSPETLPHPTKMFSRERCAELADEWAKFGGSYPQYKNDMQAMLTFIGVAWTYPKYRNQHTTMLMMTEAVAMGPLHKQAMRAKSTGLWEDTTFKYCQPNPEYSPLFREYGFELGRGEELVPQDCCAVLESKSGDIYDHCPQDNLSGHTH